MLEDSAEKQATKKTKQGQRPALDFSSFLPVPSDCFFSGVAAIGRAAGFSSLRPGPHPPDGQQCHLSSLCCSCVLQDDPVSVGREPNAKRAWSPCDFLDIFCPFCAKRPKKRRSCLTG